MPTRKMNLVDLMILVAATAAGLGLARMVLPEYEPRRAALPGYRVVQAVHDVILPCVAMLSVAAVVLRLRRPRPGLVEMLHQPGFVACVVASCGIIACMGMTRLSLTPPRSRMEVLFFALSVWNGMMVGVAWFTWRILGRWKAEPGWIDRLGRGLGTLWIALPIALWAGLSLA